MRWRDLKGPRRTRLDELRAADPCTVLEVPPGASPEEVRRAFLRKMRAYHPDRADPFLREHAEEVTKILNDAYERLKRDGRA